MKHLQKIGLLISKLDLNFLFTFLTLTLTIGNSLIELFNFRRGEHFAGLFGLVKSMILSSEDGNKVGLQRKRLHFFMWLSSFGFRNFLKTDLVEDNFKKVLFLTFNFYSCLSLLTYWMGILENYLISIGQIFQIYLQVFGYVDSLLFRNLSVYILPA